MKILPFDYAAYGVSGEPEHDTSGDPCWCGAEADSDGVVVHKDMIGILSDARFWGQSEAADDLAVTRAALAQARSLASQIVYYFSDPNGNIVSESSSLANIVAGFRAWLEHNA